MLYIETKGKIEGKVKEIWRRISTIIATSQRIQFLQLYPRHTELLTLTPLDDEKDMLITAVMGLIHLASIFQLQSLIEARWDPALNISKNQKNKHNMLGRTDTISIAKNKFNE